MKSAPAYEKSYDVVAAVAMISSTGVTTPVEARPLKAPLSPADQASLANFVAVPPSVVDETAVARMNDGATVRALLPAPVTSVALPALIAIDAPDCAAHGAARTNSAQTA